MRSQMTLDNLSGGPQARRGRLGRPVLALDNNTSVVLDNDLRSLHYLKDLRAAVDQLLVPLKRDFEGSDSP